MTKHQYYGEEVDDAKNQINTIYLLTLDFYEKWNYANE